MGYNKLSESTLTEDERMAEAGRLGRILKPFVDDMRDNERSIVERAERGNMTTSIAQLYWLRDLRDKYAC